MVSSVDETTGFRGMRYFDGNKTTTASTDLRCNMRRFLSLLAALAAVSAMPARAQDGLEIIGAPKPAGLGFQPAATELARDLQWLDGMILVIITVITLFVCLLLAICILRFNSRANPNPAKFTHNSPLEVAWTVVPIVILVFIGAFSLPVLFKQQEIPNH